ncbi:FAD binding domain-containing protein [Roseococcus thiosulfatophilus]|uniref:FAD binding domain-containing protein n=1 Tax=Roseococcus thiosulfatophilus TaxID=35813 RepID=UPI001A905C09|nr:FAD binding domain-containing protein [Roseococcus thiosulfatophilus]
MRPFRYTRATSVAEAVEAAMAGGADTRYLAGGTTIYDLMKLGVEAPAALIDITGIRELEQVSVSAAGLSLGALARMSDVAEHAAVRRDLPVLSEALWKAASQQIRNMATIGGNLLQRTRCAYFRFGAPFACNKRAPGSGCSAMDGMDRPLALLGTSRHCIANYPGDLAVALAALDAEVDVIGPAGRRSIPIESFFLEPGETPHIETSLAHGELITHVRIPRTGRGRASTYHKIRDRESYAFALTSAAVALEMDGASVGAAQDVDMLPLRNDGVVLAAHPPGKPGLRDIREQLGCGEQFGLGSLHTLSAVEFHQPHAVGAEGMAFHGEIAGWRGEQPNRVPQLTERGGIVAGERLDVVGEEGGDILVEGHVGS